MKKIVSLVLVMAMLAIGFAMAEVTDFTFESRGVQVPATLTTPEGAETYPVVILMHGHGGDRVYGMAQIADALAERGVSSIRFDSAGCNESSEPFTAYCITANMDDCDAAIAYAEEQLGAEKIGIFGYSMGGATVVCLLADDEVVDAAAMLAPSVNMADLGNFFQGGIEAVEAGYAEAQEKGSTTLTNIYGAVQEIGLQWFEDLYGCEGVVEAAAEAYQGPALVVYSTDDNVVDPIATSQMVADALNAEVITVDAEQHGYGFYSDNAEVLNTVVNGIADFFAANLK